MSAWTRSLIVVAIVSALPLAAIALLARQPTRHAALLARLVPLAAGALLGAPLFHLLPEAVAKGGLHLSLIGWVAIGATAFLLIDRVLHGRVTAPVAALSGGGGLVASPTTRMRELLPLLVAGDALHNAVDGILIAGAYLDEPSLGIVTGLAIALHELPRELGTFALLIAGGVPLRTAVALNVATALLAAASAVATLVTGAATIPHSAVLLAIGAGNFLYLGTALAVTELRSSRRDQLMLRVLLFAAGVFLTALGRHTH